MSIRNSPCRCGSGKKFKQCCRRLHRVESKTFPQTADSLTQAQSEQTLLYGDFKAPSPSGVMDFKWPRPDVRCRLEEITGMKWAVENPKEIVPFLIQDVPRMIDFADIKAALTKYVQEICPGASVFFESEFGGDVGKFTLKKDPNSPPFTEDQTKQLTEKLKAFWQQPARIAAPPHEIVKAF